MVGMIFAAGLGTRLKPWTDHHPKALATVGGRPVLGLVIDKLFKAGVERIVVNTHHMAGQIHDFIKSGDYGDKVVISHEPVLLDTGGGLRKALPLIGGSPVLVHNADILTDAPLQAMIDDYHRRQPDALLLTDGRATSRFLLFKPDGSMAGYFRSETGRISPDDIPSAVLTGSLQGRHFCGVHIVSPSLYPALRDWTAEDEPFSITDFYRRKAADASIVNHDREPDTRWFDIGNPVNLAEANKHYICQ